MARGCGIAEAFELQTAYAYLCLPVSLVVPQGITAQALDIEHTGQFEVSEIASN
jgi:hypothetical protein